MATKPFTDGEQITETIVAEPGKFYGVTVVYTMHEHYVEFFAAEIFTDSATREDNTLGIVYESLDGNSNMDWETDPLKAFPFVQGSVKWDGCVNYEVGDQDRVMQHACDKGDLARLSYVLLAIYDRCRELMPCGADW